MGTELKMLLLLALMMIPLYAAQPTQPWIPPPIPLPPIPIPTGFPVAQFPGIPFPPGFPYSLPPEYPGNLLPTLIAQYNALAANIAANYNAVAAGVYAAAFPYAKPVLRLAPY